MLPETSPDAMTASRPILARSAQVIAGVVVLVAVATSGRPVPTDISLLWAVLALGGVVAVQTLSNGAPAELGFRRDPIPGWAYWIRMTGWFALIILVAGLLAAGVFVVAGWKIPFVRLHPSLLWLAFFQMCVFAPLVEEVIFRSLLTAAARPSFGDSATIVISGVLFGLIHVLRGNPGPDNLVAGFLLQWAFLRSGTILVPIAIHSAGNLVALGSHVANWHWL